MHQRLPVLSRLGKFLDIPTVCPLCQHHTETQEHLFFDCPFAKEIWERVQEEWQLKLDVRGRETLILSLRTLKMNRKMRNLVQAMSNAVIYHIWQARNMFLFKQESYQVHSIMRDMKTQLIQRVLQIHQYNHNYNNCIEFLLHR